jgi:mannose-1-phosphate guanylyltransferase
MDQAERLWTEMPDLSIDYGIMEKAEGLVVIPASFGWSDVGSWRALTAFPTDEENQNFLFGRVLPVESSGNVLYTSHGLLATVGLSNMVVVVTRGAVLVCPVDRTQDVKALVEELKKQDLTEYL